MSNSDEILVGRNPLCSLRVLCAAVVECFFHHRGTEVSEATQRRTEIEVPKTFGQLI